MSAEKQVCRLMNFPGNKGSLSGVSGTNWKNKNERNGGCGETCGSLIHTRHEEDARMRIRDYHRGDIFFADLGSLDLGELYFHRQAGARPVVIVQE